MYVVVDEVVNEVIDYNHSNDDNDSVDYNHSNDDNEVVEPTKYYEASVTYYKHCTEHHNSVSGSSVVMGGWSTATFILRD